VIGPAIERKIGVGRFSELSLSTEFKSAEWATLSGLYQVLVSNETELDFEIDRFIERLTKTPTESLFDWKRSLWSGVDNWLELLQARARKVSAIAHRARN